MTPCSSSTTSPGSTARAPPRCTRCAASRSSRVRRRAGRRDGAVRLRQVHAADPRRRTRHPDPGTVSVEGIDLASLGAAPGAVRAAIGYVFQDFNLIPALTAAENVALPRELDGERPRAARRRPRSRSRRSGSATSPTGSPTRCRAASSSGWRSPARSSATAGWSSPTSRPAPSTPRPARRPPAAPRPLRRRRRRCPRHPRGAARGLGRPGRVPARRGRGRRDRRRPCRRAARARTRMRWFRGGGCAAARPPRRAARTRAQHPGPGHDRAAGAGRDRGRRRPADLGACRGPRRSTGGSAPPTHG